MASRWRWHCIGPCWASSTIASGLTLPGPERALLITTLTVVLAWINIRGIKQSSWVVNTLTIGKLAPLVLFILAGIWFIDPARFTALPPVTAEPGRHGGPASDLCLRRIRSDRNSRR